MSPSAKHFAERLNSCLDDMGAPPHIRDRAVILSKMLDIPKQQAFTLLEGHVVPSQAIIDKVASEFEVDPNWISGDK